MTRIDIGASSLPNWFDCSRRAAASASTSHGANGIKSLIVAKGFKLRSRDKSGIGASVGTACHHGVYKFLSKETERPGTVASNKFIALAQGGMDYDRETPNTDTATFQIDRMVNAYLPIARTLKPTRMEFRLESLIDPLKNYMLTGHPDIAEEDSIIDLKFGKKASPYEAQLGGYSLLIQSEGADKPKRLEVHHVARAARTKPQPDPQIIPYDVNVAEETAKRTLEHVLQQTEKFQETGDPWAFPANPNSMLCSKKWCPAWGTDFCDLGRPEKEE